MARTRRSTAGGDEEHTTARAAPPAPTDLSGKDGRASEISVLRLQGWVGNAAVARALRPARNRTARRAPGRRPSVPNRISVQRHASFEHTLLGNTPPSRLGQAAVTRNDRAHLIKDLWRQTVFFLADAGRDPRSKFPDVRWIQLRESSLWISYGELNALADYLPDAEHIDGLPRSVVEPVLQRMRRGTSAEYFGLNFRGQASAGGWELLDAVATEKALDKATAGLGSQRYFGLLTRNACHFAPYSWHRWARFHEEASDHALAFHRGQTETGPAKDLDDSADENLRQAWLKNGYGDHFLQDSFAAGHLVNKTLVMQWFVDYVNGLSSKWWDLLGRAWWGDDTKPWYGMPDEHVMATMGTRQQPGMAGQGLYRPPTTGSAGTVEMDRALGDRPTDPQSAWERRSREGRVAGSGVNATTSYSREQNYQAYLRFLNSSFLNLAAGMTHDWFNERGLMVVNQRGDRMRVGGDSTLLTESGRLGATVAGEAAQRSQQAIDDLTRTGTTAHTVEAISALFPTKVWVGDDSGKAVPLEQWHTDVLHQVCEDEIFPDAVDSFNSKVARAGQPELLEGGLRDAPSPPPVPTNLGDFVTPSGDPMG